MTYEEVKAVYDKYYKDEYFVRVLENSTPPETRWVEGSNFVDVSFKVDERTGKNNNDGSYGQPGKRSSRPGSAKHEHNVWDYRETEGLQQVPMFP